MRMAPYVNRRIRKFDLVLETTPENFGNWLNSELRNTFPKGLKWNEEIKNLSLSGVLYDPEPEEKVQNYHYCVDGVVFDDRYQFQQRIPLVIVIEMRRLEQERIKAICECFDHPPLITYIDSLLNTICLDFEVHNRDNLTAHHGHNEKCQLNYNEIEKKHKPLDLRSETSIDRILRLVEFRGRKIKEEKEAPTWAYSCDKACISTKTAAKWVREIDMTLRVNWDNIAYDGEFFIKKLLLKYPHKTHVWDERKQWKYEK